MRMLDLFCGRWGWSRAFAARGWECVGVDLTQPPEIPNGCIFVKGDIFEIESVGRFLGDSDYLVACEQAEHSRTNCKDSTGGRGFDFICASSPCEQFSVHGMKHFHPNPKYPEMGIKLFEHTRAICEASDVPYVMENVRAAQKFMGNAVHHCGPFYLWGTGVPPLIHKGIGKNMSQQRDKNGRRRGALEHVSKVQRAALGATIPIELANAVADYAERLIEQRKGAQPCP